MGGFPPETGFLNRIIRPHAVIYIEHLASILITVAYQGQASIGVMTVNYNIRVSSQPGTSE